MPKLKIAPSLLSCDFSHLADEIASVSSADMLHVDVMDGHFVPNITIGPVILSHMKTKKFKDVHLMIEHPLKYIIPFADAGADRLIFHCTAKDDPAKVIAAIKEQKVQVGIALNPNESETVLKKYINKIDIVLVMSVYPGFGGQEFIKSVVPKIKRIRKLYPWIDIAVDGGINAQTAKIVVGAGANIIVAGKYIFTKKNRKKAISSLRNV